MIPHYPFVFRKMGRSKQTLAISVNHNTPIDEQHYLDGYIQQVEFINHRILADIDQILEIVRESYPSSFSREIMALETKTAIQF